MASVVAHVGSLVIWTVTAYLVLARYFDTDYGSQVLQTMLSWWYFILGLVSVATWTMLAWICAADLYEWVTGSQKSTPATRVVRKMQAGWTATWSYVYVVQTIGQLCAMPLGAPSTAETVALLVLSAASLASVKLPN